MPITLFCNALHDAFLACRLTLRDFAHRLQSAAFGFQSTCTGSQTTTISRLPSGKYRDQVRRQGVHRAQSFTRKIDAQCWAGEIERVIESGSSRGLMYPPCPFGRAGNVLRSCAITRPKAAAQQKYLLQEGRGWCSSLLDPLRTTLNCSNDVWLPARCDGGATTGRDGVIEGPPAQT